MTTISRTAVCLNDAAVDGDLRAGSASTAVTAAATDSRAAAAIFCGRTTFSGNAAAMDYDSTAVTTVATATPAATAADSRAASGLIFGRTTGSDNAAA